MIDTHITEKDYDLIERTLEMIMTEAGITYLPQAANRDVLVRNIEENLKDMVETKTWPFGYTRKEVIERSVWFNATEGSEMARDVNVFDAITHATNVAGQGPDDPIITRPKTRSETFQDWIVEVMPAPTSLVQEQEQAQMIEDLTSYATFTRLLEVNREYLAVPYEKLRDYAYRFQNWINRSKNIRDAIWKMAMGVISEKDFRNAVEEYKTTDDYLLGFYEEDIV